MYRNPIWYKQTQEKSLNRIFDYIGPHGIIPNGLNYNYLDSYLKYDFNQGYSIDDFCKKYEQVSTYDCHHNIPQHICHDMGIKEWSKEHHTSKNPSKDIISIYPITGYGSLLCGLGEDFTFHQNQSFFDFISHTAKDAIRNKNLYILLDYSSEGDIRERVFEIIHQELEKINLPAKKLIFVCSAVNTDEIYESWLKENPQKEKIKTAVYPWAVYSKARELHDRLEGGQHYFKGRLSHYSPTEDIDFDSKRKHKFLYLNRRLKPHRVILLSLLEKDGLLKDNLVSYDVKMLYTHDAGHPFQVDLQQQQYTSDKNELKDILKGYHSLKKRKKQTVDYDDVESVWGFGHESKDDYQNTYFSVVSETLFYEWATYISEKTFKPFAHCHPFVMVCRPGTLKYLRDIGFKTFSDFWDESYDEEKDDAKRMIKIYNLVKELTNKSDDEWVELYKKIKPILLYNREKLLEFASNTDLLADNYLKKLKELVNGDYQKNYSLL